ncbi:sugar phosphate isomerase/epimerase family protein [Streptomyces brasiliensis]|uniref:sugar phosphate isomerase/epimerase family protein n=1 Tax=Streptomyces brasiliensis TaxID=1954 RepID=UPI00166F883B|nr:TIM barrel protein [Streptomyces brasiliensis]
MAADAGFDSISARVTGSRGSVAADLRDDPAALARTLQALEETGVTVLDAEVLRLARTTPPGEAARAIELAAALGARHLLAVNTDLSADECVEELARVCDLADGSGLRVCLEFMRFSATPDLESACRIVETVGHPCAAVLVDALHLHRSGGSAQDVARLAARRPELFPYLQVCGVPPAPSGPIDSDLLLREAVSSRLLPGDGVNDLRALVEALGPAAPLSVEAPVSGDPHLSPAQRARAGAQALSRALDAMRFRPNR